MPQDKVAHGSRRGKPSCPHPRATPKNYVNSTHSTVHFDLCFDTSSTSPIILYLNSRYAMKHLQKIQTYLEDAQTTQPRKPGHPISRDLSTKEHASLLTYPPSTDLFRGVATESQDHRMKQMTRRTIQQSYLFLALRSLNKKDEDNKDVLLASAYQVHPSGASESLARSIIRIPISLGM